MSRESGPMNEDFHLCVFCGSRIGRRNDYENAAKFLGSLLARTGISLVYGGGRTGLMGALADAALVGGGRVVGVIPGHLTSKEVTHEGLSELVIVQSMHERKALMALRSDAFLALPGGVGTFEEFFEILTWSVLGLHQKPIGIWNVDGYFDPLIRMMDLAVDEDFFWDGHRETIRVFESADALDAWLRQVRLIKPEQENDLWHKT